MLAKLSVDQALMMANSHAKKGEVAEAKKLYEGILNKFSQNKRAQKGLANLNKVVNLNPSQKPPQELVNQLINFYKEGEITLAYEHAQTLLRKYPQTLPFWNILGATAIQLGLSDQAILAFKEVISLKPDDAEAYSNLGNALQLKGNLLEAIDTCKKAVSLNPNYANAHYNLANVLLDKGDKREAIKIYKRYLLLIPNNHDAYSNMGIALRDEGRLDEAIEAFKKSITLHHENVNIYIMLGNVLKDQGKFDESINIFKNCIALYPNNIEAYFNMGIALKHSKKLDESLEAYKKVIFIQPDYFLAHNNIGNILQEEERLDEAIAAYQKAISFKPDYAEAYSNMGNAFQKLGKLDEAIDAHKKSISLNPNYAEAYYNMGNVHEDQEKFDEAIKAYEKAISINSNYAEAYGNKANILKDQGKFDNSLKAYKKALSIVPHHSKIHFNMALVLQDQGKIEQAVDIFRKSIALNPDFADPHLNLSLSLLQSGQIKEGLEEYEWRWKTEESLPRKRHFSQPIWDGKTSLKDKTILLWCEQGIGDTMNWSYCLNLVTERAKHVILECQEKLVPLLKRSLPNVEVKVQDRSKDAERDDFDLHLPMGSLYKHFIDDIMEKGKVDSYLIPDPVRVQHWKERLRSIGKGPYIGISWKSSIMSPNRLQNYLSISDLYPILKMPNLTFINLQTNDYENDLTEVHKEFGVIIHNFRDLDHFNNLLDVAALCCALDVVVSNKTTVPFISAGVGTSTKIANWKQSPWNNILLNPVGLSVKIYERNTWETWENVIKLIANDIKKSN